MQKPANIKELRDDLLDAYAQLKADPRRVLQMGELANIAGKIVSSVKTELEYALLRREQPVIPFMHYDGRTATTLPPKAEQKRLTT